MINGWPGNKAASVNEGSKMVFEYELMAACFSQPQQGGKHTLCLFVCMYVL